MDKLREDFTYRVKSVEQEANKCGKNSIDLVLDYLEETFKDLGTENYLEEAYKEFIANWDAIEEENNS